MLPRECYAVDRCLMELIEALKYEVLLLFHYMESNHVIGFDEREMIVKESLMSAQQLFHFFCILKRKDSGWSHLLSYLTNNNHSSLADKLRSYAERETYEPDSKKPKRSVLVEFSCLLARYYQQNYADVPTMGDSPKHVKDVWVPLQMDGRSEPHLQADSIDHVEMLYRLQSSGRLNVALIKGDPGMGKTTLAKKIAYDWAVKYDSNEMQQFSLVLAVPLRSAGKSNRFDQLAIDYFLSLLGMEDINKEELIGDIKQLNSQLLVILDGLDEYKNYSDSPFKTSFAAPFQISAANSSLPIPMVTFKLIITSRPYACLMVKDDFPLLRFVIIALDGDHLNNFVHRYCQTKHGVDKVTEYLKTNVTLVIQVPLILTFVCYLADSVQEIPTNMTSLYDSFVRQMLRRENRQEKLMEIVDMIQWKTSRVVRTTGELAYHGCDKGIHEFTEKSLNESLVNNDSFICGFLLHKYNFQKDILVAEFPHRSIQEFFAAIHCFQLMLSGSRNTMTNVLRLFGVRDSQVGRFFFGVCSRERGLGQLTNWLCPSLLFAEDFFLQPASLILLIGLNLKDFSSEERRTFGQLLFDSIASMNEEMISSCRRYHCGGEIHSYQLPDEFKDGLHLMVLPNHKLGQYRGWCLSDNHNAVRLVCVRSDPILKFERFPATDTFIWDFGHVGSNLADMIRSLPPVKTLAMPRSATLPYSYTVAAFQIKYDQKIELILTGFRIHFDNRQRSELLTLIEKEKFRDLTVDERSEYKGTKMAEKGLTFRQLKVTVTDPTISQSELILSLIRLSLQ